MNSRRLSIQLILLMMPLCALTSWAAEPPEAPDSPASLIVIVQGVRSDKGTMRFALYRTKKSFPGDSWKGGWSVIKNGVAEWKIPDLEPGEYALACFHDKNGDKKFNKNFIGLPVEDYCFSNDAKVGLGPPSWKKVVFKVKQGVNRHRIKVR